MFLTYFAWWSKDPGGPKTYGSDGYGLETGSATLGTLFSICFRDDTVQTEHLFSRWYGTNRTQCLASGSGDKTVRFWDLTTETPLHECKATDSFSRLIRIILLMYLEICYSHCKYKADSFLNRAVFLPHTYSAEFCIDNFYEPKNSPVMFRIRLWWPVNLYPIIVALNPAATKMTTISLTLILASKKVELLF